MVEGTIGLWNGCNEELAGWVRVEDKMMIGAPPSNDGNDSAFTGVDYLLNSADNDTMTTDGPAAAILA